MKLKEFNKAFGIKSTTEDEQARFVERINQSVFREIHAHPYPQEYEDIFKGICYQLGIDPNPLIARANEMNYSPLQYVPALKSLTRGDFTETLKVLVLLREQVHSPENIKMIDAGVEFALLNATADLGVRWNNGMFYPAGAKELDEKLIEDSLEWLDDFPEVKEQFKTALAHFAESISNPAARKDTITNAYSTMEALARKILNNQKNFDNNSNDLIQKLGLSKEYASILHQYKQLANEYSSRHAASAPTHIETEAFVYLTGLLVRLISISKFYPGTTPD